jgi:hypothetical protein
MRIALSRSLVSLLTLAGGSVVGCSSVQSPKSVINDVSVAAALDSGYTVVAIDDKKVTRAKPGKEASVAPVVIAESGLHTLTLEPKAGAMAGVAPLKIAATLEPAKTYRIGKKADGSLTLVEHGIRAPSSVDVR